MKRFTLGAVSAALIFTSVALMADPTPAAAPTSKTPAATPSTTPDAKPHGKNGGPGMAERRAKMKETLESLDLTQTQKDQIAKIREDKTLDPKARKEAIVAVLTPEQKAKFDAAMPKHKAK